MIGPNAVDISKFKVLTNERKAKIDKTISFMDDIFNIWLNVLHHYRWLLLKGYIYFLWQKEHHRIVDWWVKYDGLKREDRRKRTQTILLYWLFSECFPWTYLLLYCVSIWLLFNLKYSKQTEYRKIKEY